MQMASHRRRAAGNMLQFKITAPFNKRESSETLYEELHDEITDNAELSKALDVDTLRVYGRRHSLLLCFLFNHITYT
ncbi:unnamed protein product [Clavelina lepadiformis]|uniref:Uncharacterized protein n=1 Tax=Clavelina lepadiformis TaxID=159417 RepID=A0ABP0FPQ2_CLALP